MKQRMRKREEECGEGMRTEGKGLGMRTEGKGLGYEQKKIR